MDWECFVTLNNLKDTGIISDYRAITKEDEKQT